MERVGGSQGDFTFVFNRKRKDRIFSCKQSILQGEKFGLGIDRVSPDKMCGEV